MSKVDKVFHSTLGVALVAAGALAAFVTINRNKDTQKAAERAQQAEQWDGREPVRCSYANGKGQVVYPDSLQNGFNSLEIFEMRKRIARGACQVSGFKPTAG